MNAGVDFFLERTKKFRTEMEILREIVLDCGLDEELKWGVPCYTFQGRNIVLIHAFKEYCAYLFFKGALLKDTDGLLVQQTANVQSARQIRFTDLAQVKKKKATLKLYIFQAIEVEKAGLKVKFKKTTEFPVAAEFEKRLKKDSSLKKAFKALTPGRQRAYLLYFSSPKLSSTRETRIERSVKAIMNGKGLND